MSSYVMRRRARCGRGRWARHRVRPMGEGRGAAVGTRRSRAVIVQPRRSRTVILRPGRGAPAVVRYWTGFGPGFLGDLAAFYSAFLACAVPTDVCVDGHGRPVVRCQGAVVVSAHRFLADAATAGAQIVPTTDYRVQSEDL